MTEREAWLETLGGHVEEIEWELAKMRAEIIHRSPLHAWLVGFVDRIQRWLS